MCIYIYIYVCVYIYIYIYMYRCICLFTINSLVQRPACYLKRKFYLKLYDD